MLGKFYKTLKINVVSVLIACLMQTSFANAGGMDIAVGRSKMVELPSAMSEVIVANPDIADVYVHGKDKVSIIGKDLGVTTVRIFDTKNQLLKTLDINVGYDLPAIRKALSDFLPYESIGIKMVNSNIALTGEVSSASAADKAMKIIDEFVSPKFGANKGNGKSDESSVINLLSVTGGQQVMLRVKVGEIKRTALKNLGIDLQAIKNGGSTVFSLGTGGGIDAFRVGSTLGLGGFTLPNASAVRGFSTLSHVNSAGNGVAGLITALEKNGLFKTLAEPNLVAMSGEEAQFLAGGEFPIPIAQDLGTISIEYKPFGVSVKFKPFVLSENRIRIAVEPEVSKISDEGALLINEFIIPALTTRRAKTTIELAPGESFMIAGLIQDDMQSTIDQIPGLGEIPILSALFRSTSYQREETELVITVTPYIVSPMTSGDIKLPTDDFRQASVMESFFYGALGSISSGENRASQMPTLEGPIGFMVD